MNDLPTPRMTTAPLEARAALADRREQMLFVVLRNAIPIIGVFFLGWSAQNLIVLYFVDTLGAMWALIVALALNFPEARTATTPSARFGQFITMIFVGCFLVAFLAIPLGMPLFIFLMATEWDIWAAFADQGFILGVVSIGALSLVGMLRHYQHIQKVTPEDASVKRDFGVLMTRWVIVLIVIYLIGFLLGPWGAYVMVIAYAAGTVAMELYPQWFSELFGKSGRTATAHSTPESTDAKPRRKLRRKSKS